MQNLKNALQEALKLVESAPESIRKDEIKKGLNLAISELALLELEAKSPDVKLSETQLIREAVAPFIKTNTMGQKILDGVSYRGDIPMQVIKEFYAKINSGKVSKTSAAKVEVNEVKKEGLAAASVSSSEEQERGEAEALRVVANKETKPAKAKSEEKNIMTMEEAVEAAALVIMKAKSSQAIAKNRTISETVITAIADAYGVPAISGERTRANVLSDLWIVLHNS